MNDHTSVEIFSPHYCDFCRDGNGDKARVQADYDAQTVMGAWADMCEKHYSQYGTGLGLGMGQRLIIVPRKTKSD